MPNWVNVNRTVVGKKESINRLHNIILKCDEMETPLVKNDFGNLWLGCIVTELGGDWKKIKCRGYITYYELNAKNDDELELLFTTEEAWCEQAEFRKFLEETLSDINILYYSGEEQNCIYCTNDKECTAFVLDVIDDEDEIYTYYADCDNDAIGFLLDFFKDKLENAENCTLENIIEKLKGQNFQITKHTYTFEE